MSAAEVLRVARAAGVDVAAEGGDLALNAEHEPPAEVLALLAEHKAELLALLTPPRRGPNPPAPGGLVARLVAAGATVRTWSNGRGAMASIEAPAGIPAELVAEVEARGWAIIPGGKPNPEAEHDSWLAGVPVAELGR